ncbi:DNA oxidative demethylase AlkB [Acetobacter sp. LMG 32666]|uniref:DNA oxidative demethylase AlkB n=1 Tax=Acetobacter sp. LMG 32666 TaxID=2959295 RepID=UPI0030C7CA86
MTHPHPPAQQMDLLLPDTRPAREELETGAVLMRQFATPHAANLLQALHEITQQAPFHHMLTPGGGTMSAAMTCCGTLGWVSSPMGYAYTALDPLSQRPWPAMPASLFALAQSAALAAGYPNFAPNACLLNRYQSHSHMGLHQDRDEGDITQPIVSLSLGRTGLFMWGGPNRHGRVRTFALEHGDVLVWGGPARLHYHGIKGLAPNPHALTGLTRYNMTFRHVVAPS